MGLFSGGGLANISNIYYSKRRKSMEIIDRKFIFVGASRKSQKRYTERNAVLFVAHDEVLPDLLDKYHGLCEKAGADARQLRAIGLLKDRVLSWQRKNVKQVRVADVEQGKEERRVNAPNKPVKAEL